MSDLPISDFQVTIVAPAIEDEVPVPAGQESQFAVNQHSRRSGAVIDRIDDLEGIWDQVISKLTGLAAQSEVASVAAQFQLDEIEFNVGIEAGLSVGLVTKGNASVTIKYSRRKSSI